MSEDVILEMDDLREVAAYSAESAADVLDIFDQLNPSDSRSGDAIDTAWTFARGGKRVKALRDAALTALKAAHESANPAASQVARAAMCASSAAYLHPLARSTQVKHILGPRTVERDALKALFETADTKPASLRASRLSKRAVRRMSVRQRLQDALSWSRHFNRRRGALHAHTYRLLDASRRVCPRARAVSATERGLTLSFGGSEKRLTAG